MSRATDVKIDASQYRVGDVWAYRIRDYAASQRVEIVSITPAKQSVRVEITYLDEPQRRTETVAGSKLRVPWDDVEAYDTRMADWQRIDDSDLDDVEQHGLWRASEMLIPDTVAELDDSQVRDALAIHDLAAFAEIVGLIEAEVLAAGEHFILDDTIMISVKGALVLAAAACVRLRRNASGEQQRDAGELNGSGRTTSFGHPLDLVAGRVAQLEHTPGSGLQIAKDGEHPSVVSV